MFWEKVSKGEDTECWEWNAALNSGGYGAFFTGYEWIGERRAHRISYTLEHGTIPEGMFVCHSCDNRKCVNPAHMWLGTNDENVKDMLEKGRHRPAGSGKTNHYGKTTKFHRIPQETVEEVLKRRKEGESKLSISKKLGISVYFVDRLISES